MQRYTILFIIVNAIHVSGGFSAHHQELKNCTHSIWYVPGLLLLPLTWLVWNWVLRPSSGAQELYTQHLVRSRLAAATANVVGLELQFHRNHDSCSSSKPGTYQMLCVQFLSS
jgi:hypothetical protein